MTIKKVSNSFVDHPLIKFDIGFEADFSVEGVMVKVILMFITTPT